MSSTTPPLARADGVELIEVEGLWVHKSIPALYQQLAAKIAWYESDGGSRVARYDADIGQAPSEPPAFL